jgi:RNA polymerase sigma-70 factor (ECF subfamily)
MSQDEVQQMNDPLAASQTPQFRADLVGIIPHLRAFARSLTRNREQADDLVHDAVVRALSAANQFRPGTNFKAWMFTILRNLYYNEGRKDRARCVSLDGLAIEVEATPASQEASLEFRDFRRAYWQLTDAHREVLILIGASGLSYEEAAQVCNCAVGTIKSRISRARHELAQLLAGHEAVGGRTQPTPTAGASGTTVPARSSDPEPAQREPTDTSSETQGPPRPRQRAGARNQ